MSALCLPALVVYAVLFREALAIPNLDDYDAVLDFSLNLAQLHSLHDRLLYVIAAQHGEYKLIFEHAVLAVQLALLHHISFSLLIALGNLFLLPIFFIYQRNYFSDEPSTTARLVLFLPVSYLLFQLNYAETVDWAMGSLQNLPVIAFALLAIHLLARGGPAQRRADFWMACLSAAVACTCSANGFLLAPVGILLLLQQRSYRKIAVWTIIFPLMLAVYLYKYTYLPFPPHIGIIWKVLFFLSFTGAAVENMHGLPVRHLAIFLGVAICAVFAHALKTRYRRSHPFAFYTALWIFLSAMMAASVRTAMGLQLSLSGRYKIYCDLLLIFCYGYIAQRIRGSGVPKRSQRLLYVVALSLAIIFSAASDVLGYKLLEKRRQRILAGIYQYLADPSTMTPMINPNETVSSFIVNEQVLARVRLNRALQSGIYTLPELQPKK
jgi:hypothetical protein